MWIYRGSAVGASWVMILGAMAATISAEAVGEDAVGMHSDQVPGLGAVIRLAIVISAVPAGAVRGLRDVSDCGQRDLGQGPRFVAPLLRTAFIAVASVIATAATLLASGHILETVV